MDRQLRYAVPGYPEMTATEAAQARQMLARRLRHEPLDKITGEREFYKSVFMVNNAVLTPRPDTEILVEEALKRINPEKKCRILDLGAGKCRKARRFRQMLFCKSELVGVETRK